MSFLAACLGFGYRACCGNGDGAGRHRHLYERPAKSPFAGLINEGSTGYLNVVLQVLYHTPQLMKYVFQCEFPENSPASELQKVFYILQTSSGAVAARELATAPYGGWGALDPSEPFDAFEVWHALVHMLEANMKGTVVHGIIPHLVSGEMISYTKCIQIEHEKRTTESFYTLQLYVEGLKDIYESLRSYTSPWVFESYTGPEHGYQDANWGTTFSTFPLLLCLQLKRFKYNEVYEYAKIHDRFEFYDTLVLDEFVKPEPVAGEAEGRSCTPLWGYTLHSVIVHTGDIHGGCYTVFINPKGDDQWYEFADEVVTRCTKSEAIEDNFGGPDTYSSAYVLTYIRDSDLDSMLGDVTEDDIPKKVLQRLKARNVRSVLKCLK